MFKVHRIWSRELSVRNLVLLFFTIVFGFASVITLAQLTIDSNINNAWQTIAGIKITASGMDSLPVLIELSSGGMTINAWGLYMKWSGIVISSTLTQKTQYTGKVLGIDSNGNVIYTNVSDMMTLWSDAWTVSGNNIYAAKTGYVVILTGNVGIGTATPISGKLQIVNNGGTDVYIEEQKQGQAANLNLKNTYRTWTMWWATDPDVFYIGTGATRSLWIINIAGWSWNNAWYVGIWTTGPSYKLDVSWDIRAMGNMIASWSIRFWNINVTCSSSNQWSMRLSGACFQWCDGYKWVDIWWSWCAIMCTRQ